MRDEYGPRSAPKIISYGYDFKYDEFAKASNPVTAFFVSLGLAVGGMILFLFPPARWLVRALSNPFGKGPSDE